MKMKYFKNYHPESGNHALIKKTGKLEISRVLEYHSWWEPKSDLNYAEINFELNPIQLKAFLKAWNKPFYIIY